MRTQSHSPEAERTEPAPPGTTDKLKYRNQHGFHFARDDKWEYMVRRRNDAGSGWVLRIRELVEIAGIKHAVGQPDIATTTADTMREAKAYAQEYHDLGDDYRSRDHGYVSRLSCAQRTVVQRGIDRLRAEIDAMQGGRA
jgi:hypothetical protein